MLHYVHQLVANSFCLVFGAGQPCVQCKVYSEFITDKLAIATAGGISFRGVRLSHSREHAISGTP